MGHRGFWQGHPGYTCGRAFQGMDTDLKRLLKAFLARLDKVDYVNSFVAFLHQEMGDGGNVTDFSFDLHLLVGYQAQGLSHVLDSEDIFATVQPNSTTDSF